MATFFITGIDTGIGKTLATGLAARYYHRQGKKVITQKLVQTGRDDFISDDILEHRRLMDVPTLTEDVELPEKNSSLTCPYSFAYPASPHLAARLENQTIEPERIARFTEILQNHYDIVFLEGAGGFLVPLTPDLLTADYIAQQQYPIILITSGRLGSINHTLLTIEAIRQRNLPLACLVFNQYPSEKETISNESFELFRRICPNVIFMPRVDAEQIPEIDFSCLGC
jgi:dethiobiotin synthetase